jgi:GntR family phosphonate transport system transcriptional regulator
VDYRRKWTRVTARMPSGREADMLQQPRTRPVLVSESVNVDPDGRLIEFGLTRFNSDWVQIVLEP